jgi:hypothetical protein
VRPGNDGSAADFGGGERDEAGNLGMGQTEACSS